jgi:hypothetical protein
MKTGSRKNLSTTQDSHKDNVDINLLLGSILTEEHSGFSGVLGSH